MLILGRILRRRLLTPISTPRARAAEQGPTVLVYTQAPTMTARNVDKRNRDQDEAEHATGRIRRAKVSSRACLECRRASESPGPPRYRYPKTVPCHCIPNHPYSKASLQSYLRGKANRGAELRCEGVDHPPCEVSHQTLS